LLTLAVSFLQLTDRFSKWAQQVVGASSDATDITQVYYQAAPDVAGFLISCATDLLGSSFRVDSSSITQLQQHTPQRLLQWDHQLQRFLKQLRVMEGIRTDYEGFFDSFKDLLTTPINNPPAAAAAGTPTVDERLDPRALRLQRRAQQVQQVAATLQQLLERAQGMSPPANLLVRLWLLVKPACLHAWGQGKYTHAVHEGVHAGPCAFLLRMHDTRHSVYA
jgi:hypothetical protein